MYRFFLETIKFNITYFENEGAYFHTFNFGK